MTHGHHTPPPPPKATPAKLAWLCGVITFTLLTVLALVIKQGLAGGRESSAPYGLMAVVVLAIGVVTSLVLVASMSVDDDRPNTIGIRRSAVAIIIGLGVGLVAVFIATILIGLAPRYHHDNPANEYGMPAQHVTTSQSRSLV